VIQSVSSTDTAPRQGLCNVAGAAPYAPPAVTLHRPWPLWPCAPADALTRCRAGAILPGPGRKPLDLDPRASTYIVMFEQIDHIGIAVRSVPEGIALYRDTFGVQEWERIALPDRHMDVAVARIGGALIELLAPTSDAAAFTKFLQERGPGVHHIAYRVADIHAALAQLAASGAQLIDTEPRPGIHDTLVAFVHPRSAQGVLIELVQHRV
jgi:methylmalonyl-CoA/ethylmalonyl-CoA epimerase